MCGRDPDAARASEQSAETLRGQSDCGCVDDRHQLFEMIREHTVEQELVAILQLAQLAVALDGLGQRIDFSNSAFGLLFN